MVKPRLYNTEDTTRNSALFTLNRVLINALKLLHPFIPFITEEIFTSIQSKEETIMFSKWPEYEENYNFEKEEKTVELIKSSVKSIRNLRSEMNVGPSKKIRIYVVSKHQHVLDIFNNSKSFFSVLSSASEVFVQNDNKDISEDAISTVINEGVIYMPFEELVDISKEKERLSKERDRLTKEVERVEKKLNNQGFVSKAPENVINEEREKQLKYSNMLEQVEKQLKAVEK